MGLLTMDIITVIICEDHVVMRTGLTDILTTAGITVLGAAGSGDEAIELARNCEPDVMVVDLTLGSEDDGPSVIRRILNALPNTKIVVFSVRQNIYTIIAAYKEGAMGYVTKNSDPTILIEAIQSAKKGMLHYMPGIAEKISSHHVKGSKDVNPADVLNDKDLAIFKRLAEGIEPAEIANELGLHPKTLANRISSIRQKLGCSRAEFHRLALEFELIRLY